MDEYVRIEIPKNIHKKIERIVKESDGLFEDESDYVTHCIVAYNWI